MSTPEGRRAERNADARAAAAKRAEQLRAAETLINDERDALLEELAALRLKETDPDLKASEATPLLREIQARAYQLHKAPFHVDGPTLAKVVGRSKQKMYWWFDDQPWLRTGAEAPQDQEQERSPAPGTPQP